MMEHPTICIIGSGAVGGYYGARLAQHGNDVHFLLRGDYDAVRKNGWTIQSYQGDFKVSPGSFGAHRDAATMPKADLILVTLKTTANHQFPSLIAPVLKEETAILTLQNGLGNEERLAELFGRQRVLGGMAFTCINRTGPGQIHHMAEGWIRMGEFGGGQSPRASAVAALLNASRIECTVLDDLRRGRWEKLSWNIPFNGLGAVMDCTTDQLISTPAGVALVSTLIDEVVAGAKALGVHLSQDLVQRQIEKTRPMGPYQTSMQVDRRERREMEVEAILGEPLRQATAAGARMPTLDRLYAMAQAVNEGICGAAPTSRE